MLSQECTHVHNIHSFEKIRDAAELDSSVPNPNTASSVNICALKLLMLPGARREANNTLDFQTED